MKKLSVVFALTTLIVFALSFVTADELDIGTRVLCSVVFGVFGALFLVIREVDIQKNTSAKETVAQKKIIIYVFPYNKRQFKYRVEQGRVYEKLSNKVAYYIEGEKIYSQDSTAPKFYIKNNRIYNYTGSKKVLYRIEGNKIYFGDLSRVPLYEMKKRIS